MPEGTEHYEFHLGKQFFTDMENAEVREADVKVIAEVVHRNGVYDITFNAQGVLTLPCDRCLDDLEIPVDTTYHITVKYGDDYRDDSDEFIEIPESDAYLNVAYMIYDTVILAIPMKHVHPMGKCSRAMSSLLKKHRAHTPGDPDAELEDELIDEIDDAADDDSASVDPRWEKLKDLDA